MADTESTTVHTTEIVRYDDPVIIAEPHLTLTREPPCRMTVPGAASIGTGTVGIPLTGKWSTAPVLSKWAMRVPPVGMVKSAGS